MGEFLVYNAKIYQSGQPDQTWMVFSRSTGRVIRLGASDPPVSEFAAPDREDYGGRRILPGIHDSHIHVSAIGKALLAINLKGCASIEEFQRRVKEYAEKNPQHEWLYGQQWEQDVMGQLPSREDLDAVVPDRPVIAMRVCLHIGVANSKALELAGITKDTPDPEGGVIDRYPPGHPHAGQPTGVLREGPALKRVTALVKHTDEEIRQWITMGLQYCLEHGLSAVHSNEPGGRHWSIWSDLARNNLLPIRTFMACYYTDRNAGEFPTPGESPGARLSCDRVKIFADGALGSSTARMSLPYHRCNHDHGGDGGHGGDGDGDGGKGDGDGEEENYGVLIQPQDELNRRVHEATARGYRLEIHVIGDAAADAALTALEAADVAPQKRPILTHCQILREDLIGRMKAIGAVANIQPQFVPTDARWLGGLLNERLLTHAYAWKTLIDEGIPCAGGSDAPVEVAQPFLGIYDAIFRPSGDRDPAKLQPFRPEECLSVTQAIDLYTKCGAYATFREQDLGQLRPGYFADFVVIGSKTDVVENPVEFLEAVAEEVWVAGERKHKRS